MNPESHVTDQLAAYALNILTAEETAEVDAHLADCTSCQQELQAYREVTGMLALGTTTVTPPPTIKQKLLEHIQPRAASVDSPVTTREKTDRLSFWQKWFQKRPIWQPVLLLILIILAVSNLQLQQRLEDAREPAGFGTVTLTSPEGAYPASGIIIISADGEHGTLVVQDLPFLPESQAYQLWLNKDNQRISGPVFNVAEDGYRAVWVQAPEPLGSYETFGITIEPAGGSPGPTGEKVLGN